LQFGGECVKTEGAKMIFEGPDKCSIYVVAEKEGEFTEGTTRVLGKLMMDVGIVRGDCRVAYILPNPTEGEERKELIKADIKHCHPNVVVLLGNEVLHCMFGHRGITEWRGSVMWHTRMSVKCIPTIHPTMLIKQWDLLPLALFDWRRIREESTTPLYSIPQRDFTLAPTFEQTMCVLEEIQSKKKKVAFDIETTELWISAIAFATSPFEAISIPFTFSKGVETINYWHTVEEEIAIMGKVKEIMEDERIEKIAQNAQFDCSIFAINPPYIHTRGLVLDTMCAHHTIYPELPKSLATLCSIYTGNPTTSIGGKRGRMWYFGSIMGWMRVLRMRVQFA
jgi:hypothetical protein